MTEPVGPGAPPARGMIPLCIPEIAGNEWKYIKECLDTNWVSSVGPFVDRFEGAVAEYIGADYGVATANGTAALHTALLVAGVEPDDEVLVSTLSFIAPANAIRYTGAWPVFVDSEPDYWQMDPQRVIDFLEQGCRWNDGTLQNKATGRRIRAILPVHILGHPVDLDPILEAARKYELVVIEDASESIGARYKGRMVGTLADIACFSFNGNKVITTGGGGMITTDNEEWARRAKYLTTQAKDPGFEYIHQEIGYNYRLSNILAAMGCAQMERLDEYLATKLRIATSYTEALGKVPGITPMSQADWAQGIFWLYTALVDENQFGIDSRALINRLDKERIQTRPLWQPIHSSPAYKDQNPADCPVADRLYRDAISLPCSVGISTEEIERVVTGIGPAA